ncbi:MAG: Fic family protein [Endomicrobium sp.]|jgi:hypothetical protein|nr:Fic family protein [Endomicrobium sp.]
MATIQKILANSLKKLQKVTNNGIVTVVEANQLSRIHLQRLVKNGFLKEVLKGWYILSDPSNNTSIVWFSSFWHFVAKYANSRFGKNWCLSAEQSLSFYGGNKDVPYQVIIRTLKSTNNTLELLHNTSILYFKAQIASPLFQETDFALRLYSLSEALIKCRPEFFKKDPITIRVCLSQIRDIENILKILVDKGHTMKAGRLAGAFRSIGYIDYADKIIKTMKSFGYNIKEENPFNDVYKLSYSRSESPYCSRLKLTWGTMRKDVIKLFPTKKQKSAKIETCLKEIEAKYGMDAYNSLSIEGYKVSDELIEKVKSGKWNPDGNILDAKLQDTMAARGYWQCFQSVKKSASKVLRGENSGYIANKDHQTWYKELFSPSVSAGLLKPSDLIGYRTHQVYIRSSMHTPLNLQAVRETIPVFFDLLKNEPSAEVRSVLGHFFFVYIHPYMDGNGRMARFLMNIMLISGGYSWVIIPVGRRNEYIQALEKASVECDIKGFTKFIVSLI